jgi:hypothetical protein
MKINDLTKDQLAEIAKLAFGHPEWIVSDLTFFYQPYIKEHYEDAREYQMVEFEGYYMGNTTAHYRIEITPELNVWWFMTNPKGMKNMGGVQNQRLIQQKFTEFGF